MDSVRARILFTDNFSETATAQRRCLILVPRNECTTVHGLKEYIRNKFYIEHKLKFELSIDGYHLPEWESSEIIRENDTLCVFIESSHSARTESSSSCSHAKRDHKSKKRRKPEKEEDGEIEPEAKKARHAKSQNTEEMLKDQDRKRKKQKHRDKADKQKKGKKVNQLLQEGQNETKKRKCSVQEFKKCVLSIPNEQKLITQEDGENDKGSDAKAAAKVAGECESHQGVNEVKDATDDASLKKDLLSQNKQNEKKLASQENLENSSKDGAPTKRKRRRRKRKRKGQPNDSDETIRDASMHGKIGPARQMTAQFVAMNGSCQGGKVGLSNQMQHVAIEHKHSSGHIVFESDGDSDSQLAKANPEKGVVGNDLKLTNDIADNLLTNSFEKIREGSTRDQILPSGQQMGSFEMTEDKLACTDEDEEGQKVNQTDNKATKNYEIYPTLNGPPRNGDIIAFKTLQLSSDYTPEVSGFKEGVVTNYDHKTQQVDVQLTVLPGVKGATLGEELRDGRFEMELDEDWMTDRQQEQEATQISAFLPSLIEVKLIT